MALSKNANNFTLKKKDYHIHHINCFCQTLNYVIGSRIMVTYGELFNIKPVLLQGVPEMYLSIYLVLVIVVI